MLICLYCTTDVDKKEICNYLSWVAMKGEGNACKQNDVGSECEVYENKQPDSDTLRTG